MHRIYSIINEIDSFKLVVRDANNKIVLNNINSYEIITIKRILLRNEYSVDKVKLY